jgi:hypothetical protein
MTSQVAHAAGRVLILRPPQERTLRRMQGVFIQYAE